MRTPSTAALRAALGAQAAVTVGPAGDAFEHEADHVAEAVVQRAAVSTATAAEQADRSEEDKRKDKLRRSPIEVSRLPDAPRAQRLDIKPIDESEIAEAEPPTGAVAAPPAPVASGPVPPTDNPGPGGLEGPLADGVTLPVEPEPGITEDDVLSGAEAIGPVDIGAGGAISGPPAPAPSGETGGADGVGDTPASPAGPAEAAAPVSGGVGEVAQLQPSAETPAAARGFGPRQAELDALRAPGVGEPIPEDVHRRVGETLGADLGHVRLHRGRDDAEQAARLGARAFALGPHIWLGHGERPDDLRLMAHEMTHVVQQGYAPARPRGPPAADGPPPSPSMDSATEATPVPLGPVDEAPRARGPPVAGHGVVQAERVQRGIRDLIPAPILRGAGQLADRIPGFRILTFALDSNPITGEGVTRTGAALSDALWTILPERVVTALRESGAGDRAVAWFTTAIAALKLSIDEVVRLMGEAWDRIRLLDGIQQNLKTLVDVFGPLLTRVRTFIVGAAKTIFELVFEAALAAAGGAGQRVIAFFRRAKGVFGQIVAHPGAFATNLLGAVGGGIKRFASNIGAHLKSGLVSWLTGTLSEAGVELPKKWSLRGVIGLALQLLGLTWANIRRKLIKQLDPNGERKVSIIEKGVLLVRRVIEGGISAVVPLIINQVATLLDMVTGGIIDFVIEKIAVKALTFLSGLFTGGLGSLLQLLKSVYDVATWLLDKFDQIAAVLDSIVTALDRIVSGDLEPAASSIEGTLANLVPVLIGLLAAVAGLGGLPKHIRNLIQRLARPVDRMLDKLVGWVVGGARKILAKARQAAQAAIAWFRRRFPVEGGGETHTISFDGPPPTTHVMIESVPTEIGRWLNERVKDLQSGSPAAPLEAEARAKLAELTAAIQGAKQSGDAGKTVLEKAEIVSAAIKALLTHLGPSGGKLPLTKVTYSNPRSIDVGGTPVVVGGTMTAHPLSPVGEVGSTVSGKPAESLLWQRLARRRSGGGSFWVQGHLLSKKLHGPGNTFENLSPITQNANNSDEKSHEKRVESKIKAAVPTDGTTPKRNPVVHYEVKAVYPPSPRALPDTTGMKPEVVETLKAESHLAEAFVCKAWYLTRDSGGEWTEDTSASPPLLDGEVNGEVKIPSQVPMTGFDLGSGGVVPDQTKLVLVNALENSEESIPLLRSVAGIPPLVKSDNEVAKAVLLAGRGPKEKGHREWADYRDALATLLAERGVAKPSELAEQVSAALKADSGRTVLFTRPEAGQ